jgi:hypothetical protein
MGQEGATARRALSLYDGRRRARASDPAEVGGDGNNNGDKSCPLFPLLRLALCRGSYGRNHMAGKKKFFPGKSHSNSNTVEEQPYVTTREVGTYGRSSKDSTQ